MDIIFLRCILRCFSTCRAALGGPGEVHGALVEVHGAKVEVHGAQVGLYKAKLRYPGRSWTPCRGTQGPRNSQNLAELKSRQVPELS